MTIDGRRMASQVISELYVSHPLATLIELSRVVSTGLVLDIETMVDFD